MGGDCCLGLFPKKSQFFFAAFPNNKRQFSHWVPWSFMFFFCKGYVVCMSICIYFKQRVSIQCVKICDSSGCLSFGKRQRISCKQWVSCQCGKVWDISDHLNSCKKNCTDYMKWVFHQNAAAYVSWDFQHGSIKGHAGHSWNAFPLNELTAALWGHPFLERKRYTECTEIVYLLNEWAGVAW